MSDVPLWSLSHRRASVGWLTRTFLKKLCMDRGCSLEDLPDAMDDRDKWWERELRKSVHVAQHDDDDDTYIYTCIYIYIYIYILVYWYISIC